MAETKQNLPFRPLEVRGHGVWDPERKAFYPFKASDVTVLAKPGIRYFIHSMSVSGFADGITNAGWSGWDVTVNSVKIGQMCVVYTPGLTQETDYFSMANSQILDVLTDVNTPLTKVVANLVAKCNVVYAEIPDDISGQ